LESARFFRNFYYPDFRLAIADFGLLKHGNLKSAIANPQLRRGVCNKEGKLKLAVTVFIYQL
jgi:hypothetical protein